MSPVFRSVEGMKQHSAQLAATAAHLGASGLIVPWIASLWLAGVAGGLGLLFVLLVGLVPLALTALSMRWIAWFETRRVAGLYGTPLLDPGMRVSRRTDWLRVPHTLVLQYADGANWRAVLHMLLSGLLGVVVLGALTQLIGAGLGFIISPLLFPGSSLYPWGLGFQVGQAAGVGIGALAVAAGLAIIVGASFLARAASLQLLAPSREAELEQTVEDVSRRREGAVRAAETERARIERDLHDGVQPRLVSVAMTLGLAKHKLRTDPDAAAKLIDEAHASTKEAVTELRQLARGIHPSVLTDRGLDAALSALAARSHIPVHLDVRLEDVDGAPGVGAGAGGGSVVSAGLAPGRCGADAEAAMYFAVAEALGNAAKHSEARAVRVRIERRPSGMLWARIEDDGRGGARRVPGGGIDGMADRIAAAGGTLSIMSPAGGPTTLEVSLPCAS